MTQSAKVVLASRHPQGGPPLITQQLRYPKFIHGELMTHRVFSRNASSSRAIPVERLIQDVKSDPAMPLHWGKNQPGMQAREECNNPVRWSEVSNDGVGICLADFGGSREKTWLEACGRAIEVAGAFADAGYHKQIVNRLLEPFCHINVIVTATEWDNFFRLRCHPDAQPEMRDLAEKMREANENAIFQTPDGWHTPYVSNEEWDSDIADWMANNLKVEDTVAQVARRVSAARCARVSYLTHEGKKPDIGTDLALFDRLASAEPIHASPMEHQAAPDRRRSSGSWRSEHRHGNFIGWIQHRKLLEAGL